MSYNEHMVPEHAAAAAAHDRAELARMYAELKKTLKPMSKNQLIHLVGATLIDNFILKSELERLKGANSAKISNDPGIIGIADALPSQSPSETK